uniref:Glutathione S-transferase omega-like 2 n=1 Tax=Phallusia mammillata TaxID=59560 RepID=A0A6F9DE16_9ASCI|nr:glutathione S-transferase omega-like 2 [Phallusia mammillata]
MSEQKHLDVSSLVSKKGEFVRNDAAFRNHIEKDGEFPPENGRYHLYVSYACPWAHRTLITRKLKGLEDAISFTVVDFLMLDNGWRFNEKTPGCERDPIFDAQFMRDIYKTTAPEYTGRITVPVLFDKTAKKIVNNESSEIIRMLNCSMNEFSATDQQRALDFYPVELREEIDAINAWVYPNINNGVYRCGFAQSQEAYDKAVQDLFENLEKAEELLSKQRYLVGNRLTEADIRLFTTLIRFDQVYHGHFKCNKKRIIDYPNIWGYLRELYQIPAFRETTDMNHIRKHYMMSHRNINPYGIVSVGPDLDFNAPHDRNEKFPIS